MARVWLTALYLPQHVKLFVTRDGRIHGASIVCERAGELINEVSVAMRNGLTLKQLASGIHAYPSFGMALQRMASDAAVDALFDGCLGSLLSWFRKV